MAFLKVLEVIEGGLTCPTPGWRTFLDESWNTELLYASLFSVFYVESEYITFKMIHWANLKGRQY